MLKEFTEIKKKILDYKYRHLNPVQKEVAFLVDGPILILAGAGSGKTTAITNRISYMIKYGDSYNCDFIPANLTEDLFELFKNTDIKNPDFMAEQLIRHNPIDPYNILAITFTNKAADEMRERIEKLVGVRANNMWVSTFHSACVKILRQDIDRIGYEKSFAIFDTADSTTLIKDCMKELNIDEKIVPARALLSYISSFKDKYIMPDKVFDFYEHNSFIDTAQSVYKIYQEKLIKYNALDFDDILLNTVILFKECPDVLLKWQKRFKYVIVDEYQDTSKIQYMLISLLCQKHQNICVVGDDDQSIYKFRGADIENILSFEKQFPNAKVVKLEQNYRSTKNILDAANAVILNNVKRKNKKLWTDNKTGEKIRILTPYNEKEEAAVIGDLINDYVNKGNKYSDIAILYRMNAQSRAIEESFLRNAIPHRVVGGMRFFDKKEIKDIIAYMRLAYNLKDDLSLKRIINEPKRGIGKTALEKFEYLALKENRSIFEVLEDIEKYTDLARYYKEIKNFVKMIRDFTEDLDDIERFAISIIYGSGYMDMLNRDQSIESRTRAENVMELISMVKDYKNDNEDNSVSGFLENMALLSDIDNYENDEDAVVLMSMHSAKGLEFKIVFIVGLEEGIFPSSRSIGTIEELEEERRLLYVAITRAKEFLYITVTSQRMLFGMTNASRRSRFLSELPEELLDKGTEKYEEVKIQFSYNPYKESQRILTENVKTSTVIDYKEGDRVMHQKFGEGTVLEMTKLGSDYKLKVSFDSAGIKTLMATFAKLKKI